VDIGWNIVTRDTRVTETGHPVRFFSGPLIKLSPLSTAEYVPSSGLSRSYIISEVKGKSKVKLSLCVTNEALRHEDVWGSWCIDPHFLDLGSSWTLSLYPRYPLYRKLCGLQSRSGRYGEVKKLKPKNISRINLSLRSVTTTVCITTLYMLYNMFRPFLAIVR
jgi:hypothetical protein